MENIELPVTPRTRHQLGVLILDGSPSMEGLTRDKITKAEAVSSAVGGLLTRLKASRKKRNFSIAVVTFSGTAHVHTPVTAVEDINDYGDYDPLEGQSGGTNIAAALQEADRLADEFLANESEETVPRSVVLVLMSDGVYNEGEDPVPVAGAIKQNEKKTICATLFRVIGGDASEATKAADALRAIASSPAHYRETYDDIESLRKFFEASVSASRAT